MSGLLKDLCFALRMLTRRPGFTVVTVTTIALGIAAVTVVFSIVNGVLLQPLPYPEADRLIVLGERHAELFSANWFVSPLNFRDWRERTRTFEEMSAWQRCSLTLTGDGEAERIETMRVTAGFFAMMGIPPQLGRGFTQDEDRPDQGKVVVLSHRLWQRRFDGDPQIIGRSLTLDGEPYLVVGVATKQFRFTRDVELWTPLALQYDAWPRDLRWAGVLGRVKPGVALHQAESDLERICRQLQADFPEANRGWGVSHRRLKEMMVHNVRPALLLLLAAVLLVLAIAATNVANLLLSRGATRRRELAIRQALGAGRQRLVRQLLTESLVLALAGGVLGLLLAFLGTDTLLKLLPSGLPRAGEIGISGVVLASSLGATFITGLLFGALPALQVSGLSTAEHLHAATRSVTGEGVSNRLRKGLVVAEVSLALVLLVGASLLITTLVNLLAIDPGFDAQQVLTAAFELPAVRYGSGEAQAALYEELLQRVRSLPGVAAAGTIHPMPMVGAVAPSPFVIDGRPALPPDSTQETPWWLASPGYFEAMGIPLRHGRGFTSADTAGSPVVAVINQTLADRYFADDEAIGRRLAFGRDPAAVSGWATIIGIVGDVRHDQLLRDPGPQLYLCSLQAPYSGATLTVRSAVSDPRWLAPLVRTTIQETDPDLPVTHLRCADDIVVASLGQERFTMTLLTLFAVTALVLAAVGIFGVLSCLVAQRSREVGVRMALGASRSMVLRMIVGQGMVPVLLGIAVGLFTALGLSRFLASQVYGVSTHDPLLLAIAVLVLLVVALAASVLPAWRATRIDPMAVLRCE